MRKVFFSNLSKRRARKGFEIEDSIMTITEKEEALIENPAKRNGLNILWLVILFALLFLAGRVFYLDYIKGDYFTELSQGNRVRKIIIPAPRGKIMDRYGKILAKNIPSIDAVIIPADLSKDSGERKKLINFLSDNLKIDKGNLELSIEAQESNSLKPILVKENVNQEETLILGEKLFDFSGIYLQKSAIRNYENGYIFSHLIGYDGKINYQELKENPDYLMTDYIGKTGVEKSYEKELKGVYGVRQAEVDARGNIKKDLGIINPQAGHDLILNVDEGLQKKIYDSLSLNLEKNGTKTAAAIAIDPRDGGVLAMVSLPSFDNNLFAKGISNQEYKNFTENKNLPLFNRTIKGEYPPGSTIKPAWAAAALTEKIITENTTVNCGGGLTIGNFHFGDWKIHGITDVKKAIAESCDTFFYSVGGGFGNIAGLGIDKMKHYANLFGLGSSTGIDISGESQGLFPDEEWKLKTLNEKWYTGNNYHAAIGQGYITVTPLQLANYTAFLANRGTLFQPHVVSKIKNNQGEEMIIKPEVVRSNFIDSHILEIVREGMRQTITSGTAQQLKDLPVAVAGKTGTAEFGIEKGQTHAWFISFAPYDNPEIALVILAEGRDTGLSTPVAVTKEVYDWYFSKEK